MCGLLIKDRACVVSSSRTAHVWSLLWETAHVLSLRRPPPPAARRRRRPDHENRPDRYGFNFRSRPRVVDGPCPGYTCMESG